MGHAGTLDPFATGLLLLAWGRATRLLPFLAAGEKTYAATLQLGVTTHSYDMTGNVVRRDDSPLDEDAIRAAGARFIGALEQRAPAVSAIKVGGTPLHERVRRGEDVEPPMRSVHVSALSIGRVDLVARTVDFAVTCSAGTYVRSLGHDWGEALGVGGALLALRRLAIGLQPVAGAIPTTDLLDRPEGSIPEWNERLIVAGLTPEQALVALPGLTLDAAEARGVGTGRAPSRRRALDAGLAPGVAAFRLLDGDGALLGVGALDATAGTAPDEPFDLRLVWAVHEGSAK